MFVTKQERTKIIYGNAYGDGGDDGDDAPPSASPHRR